MKPSRSTPPSYTIAEGPSSANHPKSKDGWVASLWVSQEWPQRRIFPIDPKNFPAFPGDRTPDLMDDINTYMYKLLLTYSFFSW